MKRCKTLLCLALALIMALSLCTVAMAEEGKVTSVDFTLTGYGYGLNVAGAGVERVTNLSTNPNLSGIGCNKSFFTYAGTELGMQSFTGAFDAGTQYFVMVEYYVMSEDGFSIDGALTPTMTCNGQSCQIADPTNGTIGGGGAKVDIRGENNETHYTVYFALPMLEASEITVEIPFSKIVKQDGSAAVPAETFSFEQVTFGEQQGSAVDVEIKDIVTNGAKTYSGTIVVSGSKLAVENFLKEGFYVREKNGGVDGWTYDDAVWCVIRHQDAAVNALTEEDAAASTAKYDIDFFKGKIVDKEFEANSNTPDTAMTFTNTYTKNTVTPKPSKPAPAVVEAPKTFDGGVALCAALSVLSMTGAVVVGKKRDK